MRRVATYYRVNTLCAANLVQAESVGLGDRPIPLVGVRRYGSAADLGRRRGGWPVR
jgi:hypothetical protein